MIEKRSIYVNRRWFLISALIAVLSLIIVVSYILYSKIVEGNSLRFGREVKFSEIDNSTGAEIKWTTTVFHSWTATGGDIPPGMIEYEFDMQVENFSESTVKLAIDLIELTDEKGGKHRGGIYVGPTLVYGGLEVVPPGSVYIPSSTIEIEPRKVIDKIPMFVSLPDGVQPREFAVSLGMYKRKRLVYELPAMVFPENDSSSKTTGTTASDERSESGEAVEDIKKRLQDIEKIPFSSDVSMRFSEGEILPNESLDFMIEVITDDPEKTNVDVVRCPESMNVVMDWNKYEEGISVEIHDGKAERTKLLVWKCKMGSLEGTFVFPSLVVSINGDLFRVRELEYTVKKRGPGWRDGLFSR